MEAYGTTIFCDDIRFEQLNKVTLVGIYGAEIVTLGKFPLLLPKLGIYVSVFFPMEHKIDGVKLLVYFPGDPQEKPTHTIDLPWKQTGATPPKPAEFPDPSNFYGFIQPQLFNNPIIIKQAGYIRVRMQDGENRLKIGAIRVREASADEALAFHGSQSPV